MLKVLVSIFILNLMTNVSSASSKKAIDSKNLKSSPNFKLDSSSITNTNDLTEFDLVDIKFEALQTKQRWQTRASQFVSEATMKRHFRAQNLLSSKKYDSAVRVLDRVIKRRSSTKYEIAKTRMLMSKVYSAKESYNLSEFHLKEALDLESLSYSESCEALLSLAQVQMSSKNLIESKKNILKYIDVASPAAAPWVMLAAIEFQNENFKKAQVSIDKALSMVKKPQEPWLYLAASIHYKNQSYLIAEKYFLELVNLRQNNKVYWMSLIGVLFEQSKTTEALSYYEMANKMGFVESESDMLSRVGLMFSSEIPFKAAHELAKAIKEKKVEDKKETLESLANYWFTAKEFDKAVEAYERASQKANDGRVDLMLGQVYLEMERWGSAQKSFGQALKRGKLENQTGTAYMGLALSSFFKNEKDKAIKFFSKAKEYKNQKEAAEKWIGFLN